MKTVVIYDQCGLDTLTFAVLDGDYRHFHNCYVNDASGSGDEWADFLYPCDSGRCSISFQDEFPVEEVRNGAFVIVAGFLP